MKDKLAILLLFVFLGANTELHQLLKAPVLIHHFLEHQKSNQHESLSHFLIEHYDDNPSHSHDTQGDHNNLPFKTQDCATVHNSTDFQAQPIFSFCDPLPAITEPSVVSKMTLIPSAYLPNIWQPPKVS